MKHTISPSERYAQGPWQQDPAQLPALAALDQRFQALGQGNKVPGLYLWGDVGRGKTMLMDLFFNAVEGQPKLRLHFHHFMARVHRDLNRISGTREPLDQIAATLAKECRLLCFDEFFVSDIAMPLFSDVYSKACLTVALCWSALPIRQSSASMKTACSESAFYRLSTCCNRRWNRCTSMASRTIASPKARPMPRRHFPCFSLAMNLTSASGFQKTPRVQGNSTSWAERFFPSHGSHTITGLVSLRSALRRAEIHSGLYGAGRNTGYSAAEPCAQAWR